LPGILTRHFNDETVERRMPVRRVARPAIVRALVAALVLLGGPAQAEGAAEKAAATATPAPAADFATLRGRWVRPDGGYVIDVMAVDASGKMTASYANPSRLPFEVAQAAREGATIKVFLELRAGGYNGSSYALAYDPASDTLKGVYFQAVARQRFDVVFVRAK
jgi:uncharacterized protein (DUF2147 family)